MNLKLAVSVFTVVFLALLLGSAVLLSGGAGSADQVEALSNPDEFVGEKLKIDGRLTKRASYNYNYVEIENESIQFKGCDREIVRQMYDRDIEVTPRNKFDLDAVITGKIGKVRGIDAYYLNCSSVEVNGIAREYQ